MTISKVAILGAGNGGCAAAADLADRGYEVRLYNRSSQRLQPIIDRGGLDKAGAKGSGFVALDVVTTDLGHAVAGADLVMVTAPASAHGFFAQQLGTVLGPQQVVFLNPGHMGGGLFMAHELHRATGRADFRICEVSTLSYACRMAGPATVNILSTTTNVPFAAFPGRYQSDLCDLLLPLYSDIVPVSHVLEAGFCDINAVEHPPQIICNAGWLEHTRGDYLFYYEGTSPSVGRVIDAVDGERMAVAAALGVPTTPFTQLFHALGYTTRDAAERGSAYAALHESGPNRWIKAPPTLDHRYIHEDVGWGLVPWSEIGRAAGVPTPTMDALIVLGGALNGRDYRSEGLTLERLGLATVDPTQLETFLYNGLTHSAAPRN
jgi:opine dehydrogenase